MDHPPPRTRIRPLAWATWALLANCAVFKIHLWIESFPRRDIYTFPWRFSPAADNKIVYWVAGGSCDLMIYVGLWALIAYRSRSIWIDGICFLVALVTLATNVIWWQYWCPPFKASLWHSHPRWIDHVAIGLFVVDCVLALPIVSVVVVRLLRFVFSFPRRPQIAPDDRERGERD